MTREQLDAIRARLALAHVRVDDNYLPDARALLAEVESKVAQNVALMGQNGRLQQEVERLTAERDTAMDRMQQAIIDLLNEHNAPLHLIARVVEMEYP